MMPPASERGRWFGLSAGRALPAAAALLFAALFQAAALAAQPDVLRANLLTRDLGDPREPGNAKLVMTLPESSGHLVASARAEDFVVHIHPENLSESEGTTDRYRAGGLYLWRYKARLFLDVREVPRQDGEGRAKVRVSFAPGGRERAKGMAEGECRYASDLVDVVLAVDVSRSMNYNDPRKRRVVAARTFLEMAREGGGIGRVGLVTFNHRGDVATPLVSLEESGRLLGDLNKVGADGLTNLDIPLGLAERMFRESGSRRPVVVLLTDGRNEGTRYQNTHRRLAADGIRIFTVGLTESADHALLQEMADASDGMYFRAPNDSDLPEIYARLAAELGKRHLLRGDLLSSASGSGSIPIDATVRRIAAIADGGARVNLSDPLGAEVAGGGSGRIGSVYVGRPKAGVWNYTWTAAEAGVSGLGFFGDTPFFLDLFPPQYQGDQMAVGATLARGASPFPSGEVWLEALPGVPGGRIALYDDGLHDDGQPGDGVYGTVVDLPPDYRDRFGVTLRAGGTLPEDGAFVRQTAGIAVRMPVEPEPEIKRFSLEGGDVDFGVLFPGESGVAAARIAYEGRTSENFLFDLSWPETAGELPNLFSRVDVAPGRQVFELEIAVPPAAVPGRYRGVLDVRADSGLGDAKTALLQVGDVRFTDPGTVDLGALRPGDEVDRVITIPYHSDKATFLEIAAVGADLLSVAADRDALGAGAGELRLTVAASASPDARDGERTARIALRAGPTALEIPVQWRVQAFRGATIGGDVDFGVLFPGETGHADVSVDLDSTRPERLSFNLSWPDTAGSLPGLSVDNLVEPGRQGFTLDIAVPRDAPLGPHRGAFSIRAENGLGDLREAKIVVGTVVFDDPGALSLGEIRPGESVERMVAIPYRADKAVPLAVTYDGDGELTVVSDADSLAHGEGTLILRATASPSANAEDGDRSGTIVLAAGPARLEIPANWSVRGFRGAALGDDLDFGVAFPGETAAAEASVHLDSTRPERLSFNLAWPDAAGSLPGLSVDNLVEPGRQGFTLDIAVPRDAPLGPHQGAFSIRAENGLGDLREAKIVVGTVVFDDPGPLSLGEIRPGESVERMVAIPYRADKAVPLAVTYDGDGELAVVSDADNLAHGEGTLVLRATASPAVNEEDGDRSGTIVLTAGPARLEIPANWSVRGFRGAMLGDDLDFGVVFPGETATAEVAVHLDSTRPERLFFNLSWPENEHSFPTMASDELIPPGRQAFELDLPVAANVRPGDYEGRFAIRSWSGLGDEKKARLKVGTVVFDDPDAVDLGAIRPGASAERAIRIRYRADKEAPLVAVAEGMELSVSVDADRVDGGAGEVEAVIVAAIGADALDGDREGLVRIKAGPGTVVVPVRWSVRSFWGAALGGDVDFGVLFPGETGTAAVDVVLDSTRAEALDLSLTWSDAGGALPGLSSRVTIPPGRHPHELEIAVPADASPAAHAGRFEIRSESGLGDVRSARLVVGTVEFADPGAVNFGEVKPGESAVKRLSVAYRADKPADLAVGSENGGALAASADVPALAAGEGRIDLEVSLTLPAEADDRPAAGRVILSAGPGRLEIPVYWNIRGFQGAMLGGDVDFGVLFPGETGTAPLTILLDSTRPERLALTLRWPGDSLPGYEASPTVEPGPTEFDLELAVPGDAVPSAHQGRISIASENGLGDDRLARVVIGTVLLGDPGRIHLGEVRPGETLEKRVSLPYKADKNAPLIHSYDGDGGFSATAPRLLDAGEGAVEIALRAAEPADAADGERSGVLTLRAGPATREIPVSWTALGFRDAALDGDIDFGVVFPGETARAEAPLALDSTRPETLTLDLSWPDAAPFLPSAHFDQQVLPGKQTLELELPIPADAVPGLYQGRFSVGAADGGPGDSRPARIRVGAVRLDGPGGIDMGDVPPGTFVAKTVGVSFDADRGVGLTLDASGDPVLSATSSLDFLPAGHGEIDVEVVVSAPIGSVDGPRSGAVTLRAGPGMAGIPVAWNVRAYAPGGDGGLRAGADMPFSLPDPEQVAPVLPDPHTGSYRPETYLPDSGRMPAPRLDDSPLDRTRAAIDDAFRRTRGEEPSRDGDRPWREPSTPAGLDDGGTSESGDGSWWPWNAWWIYLLAALLLLLLLLLLLAYILYKLRKKALLLLAAILANLILLAIFIALLSTSFWDGGAVPSPIEVNLVEMDDPERYGLTPRLEDSGPAANLEVLEALRESDDAGGAGAGSSDSLLAELAGAAAAAGASGSPLDRPDELPGEAEATGELAAQGVPEATAVAMERTSTSPRRRERRAEREARDLPNIAMPELAEPPPSQPANVADANATAESREVVGERVDVEELVDPGAPAWSGQANGPEIRAGDPAQLSAEAMEMEFVAREPTLATAEPRGRRRNRDQAPSLAMEPRVLIDDPVRDNTEKVENVDMSREPREADFGVEEMRIDASAGGMPSMARRAAGPAIPAGSSELASGDQARAVEGVRESSAEPNRSSRRERQTDRESGGPPVRSPSTLTADASGSGQRPARPAGGPGSISSGESRFEAGPGGMGDALDGAEAPGGDRLGMELADAGRPGSLTGTDDSGRAAGRTGLKSSDGRSGGASEPGSRGGRGRRGGRAGDGLGDRDHGDGDGRGTGTTGPGDGSSGAIPGGGSDRTGPGGSGKDGDRGDGRGGDKGDGRGYGSGRGSGSGDREGRVDDLGPYGGVSSLDPAGLRVGGRDASSLEGLEDQSTMRFPSPGRVDTDWERGEMRQRRRRGVAPASSVDKDALLIVLGDFVALSDDAPRNLFAVLAERLAPNVDVEERVLRPGDSALGDCLLGVVTPAEVEKWTESELRSAAAYLRSGGHIWLDSANRGDNARALRLLADAADGEVRALPADHQLADSGPAEGLFVAPARQADREPRDILGVVATSFGWRERWRYGDDGDSRTLRFLVRALNLFLSGDADVGLSVDVAEGRDGLAVLGAPPVIPEMVVGVGTGATAWEDHRSGDDSRWRLPSWSDKADLSVVSDGKGGRALRLDLGAAERGRASVYRVMSPPEDFGAVERMTIDVYYGGDEGEAALSAVITAPENGQWVDFETRPRPLARGWNKLEIRPAADRFRSAITGWREYDARPSELDRVGRLGIILYRDEKSAEVLLLGQIDLFESVPD